MKVFYAFPMSTANLHSSPTELMGYTNRRREDGTDDWTVATRSGLSCYAEPSPSPTPMSLMLTLKCYIVKSKRLVLLIVEWYRY